MAFRPANRTLILRGLTCLLTLAGLVLLLAAVAPGTSAALEADVPVAPRNFKVSPSESGEIVVSWEAPAGDGGSEVTGYRVQWKEATGSWDTLDDVSEAAVTGTTHTITGLTNGVEYALRVIATNSIGVGAPSAEATATPAAPTPTPETQPVGSRSGSAKDGVYTWRDGDRIMHVQLVSETPIGSKSAGDLGASGAASGGRTIRVSRSSARNRGAV